MAIIIQKFGGTSLATIESRVKAISKIIEAKNKGYDVVVVVSAMGRLGSPYATDTLLSLVDYKSSLLSHQELDLLISCGEMISSVMMSNAIKNQGFEAKALTGGAAGILTDDKHLEAQVIHIDTHHLLNLLKEGIIPVVAGFQGRGPHYEVTTIGRGGSDTTAALLGEALEAEAVEIYTDVNGIMTADPNLYDKARSIKNLSYSEVFQMADSGAKVIHPTAVEIARRSGVKMIIKNTFTDEIGTSVSHYPTIDKRYDITEKLITSIAHRTNRVQLMVEGAIDDEAFFNDLATNDVSIDIINIFPDRRVFTIDTDKKPKAVEVINHHKAVYKAIDDCCKVTVIGERMTGVPGVMAKIVHSLKRQKIDILQTADSLSTIACLVHSKDLQKAVHALHEAFELDEIE